MSYATIDFDDGILYVGNRPKGAVILHGPGAQHAYRLVTSIRLLALVDTGADFMHLPEAAANAVGISLANARKIKISTAGGVITMLQQAVDVEFVGIRVHIPVNFLTGAKPLVGRQAIFAVLDNAGFSTSEWLLDWYQVQQTQQQTTVKPQPQSVPSPQPQAAPISSRTIVDHGEYLDIGGVRIRKRTLMQTAEETLFRPDSVRWRDMLGDVVV